MRLWSLHPKYLDRKGLCGVWREGLLAQSVLLQGEFTEKICFDIEAIPEPKITGKIKVKTPWYNHPQLKRFKQSDNPIGFIAAYLVQIQKEGFFRGYKFKEEKIFRLLINKQLMVTTNQLEYEFKHLISKLINFKRDVNKAIKNLEETKIAYLSNKKDGIKILGGVRNIKPHPLFQVVEGNIESWERVK